MDTMTKNELIKNTLQDLTLEYLQEDATEFICSPDELEDYDTYEIFDTLKDNGFFYVDIMYYSKAMDYLRDNDSSLCESIEYAQELGYSLENINSETLASVHASRQKEDKFWEDVEPKLNEIINN